MKWNVWFHRDICGFRANLLVVSREQINGIDCSGLWFRVKGLLNQKENGYYHFIGDYIGATSEIHYSIPY